MTEAFISYSIKDEKLAVQLHSSLEAAGVSTFLAGISIEAGSDWTDTIFNNLKKAKWVFFLASKNSCSSHAVQQELGASLVKNKTIIPLLVDIEPEDLPGWVAKYQAIKVNDTIDVIEPIISEVSKKVQSDKFLIGLICGALIAGFFLLLRK